MQMSKEQKLYEYLEPDDAGNTVYVRMTEEDILASFWDWWKEKMVNKYGEGHELITEETCIEDWKVINCAYEIEDEGESENE